MSEFTEIFQSEIWFFRPGDPPPTKEVRAWWANPENADNPFHNFVGNQHAVRRLCRAAFEVFGRYNRQCGDHLIALAGSPSTGTLARMFGELVGLPFVEIEAHSVCDLNDVAVSIAKVLEETKIDGCQYPTLELQDLGGGNIVVPPCIVFIDEVHMLPKNVEQGLRQAVAGRFETNGWKFNSTLICWIVSTGDEEFFLNGFDGFAKIRVKPLSVEEIAQVVALHNPDLPTEVCLFVADHARSPREALAFVKEMRIEHEMHGGDWQEVVITVAKDWGVEKSTPWTNRVRRNGQH